MQIRRAPRAPRHLSALSLAALALLVGASATACAQTDASPPAHAVAVPGAAALDSLAPRADRDRAKGDEQAPVTIIEISDFQCPFCRRFAEETYPKLDSAYVQTGKVRMIFINYPLPGHAQAYPASEAAMCAGAQEKFWPMHDRIFATQGEWSGQPDANARFTRFAEELGLDMAAFRDCTENDRLAALVINDAMQAAQAGIQGTPSFILNGQKMLSGAIPFEEFAKEIDALLAPEAPARD